ncbi:MAG: SEC-C domain-containing protein [Acidobacteria bacterium]|nr:SEC-C domain-containing protein [Acidobacteriota bacterium]
MLCYGPLWVLWIGAQPFYRQALAFGLTLLYPFRAAELVFSVEGVEVVFRRLSPPAFEGSLAPEGVCSNTVLLLTLLLVTPAMPWKARARALGVAMGLLYLSHVAFLITKVEVSLMAIAHPLAGPAAFWTFWDDFFEITGKELFPVLIWLAVAFDYVFGRQERLRLQIARASAARNAPCPCGSGKKHKHFCGAS